MARMTKQQQAAMKSQLNSEAEVIEQIKKSYQQALSDIKGKIKELSADELTQSKIYQIEYQKALKSQIETIIDNMQSNQYTDISAYLKGCYEDGYIGAMYSIAGQGIPVLMPIDQDQIARAVVTDSKLSKDLYTSMGKYLKPLKKAVTQEISRGMAAGEHWNDIAARIENRTSIGWSNAIRIARTEGHRIQNAARLDAMEKAKESGADVVKQWDSTMDGSTRKSHRKLDGQIREMDELFEINGHKAKSPGHFGRPEEDINCRCAILERARWALDEDELEELKKKADYFEIDKSDEFEEFREKYLKASRMESERREAVTEIADAAKGKIDSSGWPKEFQTKTAKKRVDAALDIINSTEGADEDMKRLYSLLGQTHYFASGGKADLKFTSKSHYIQWRADSIRIQVAKMEGEGLRGQTVTFVHEMGHYLDAAMGSRFGHFSDGIDIPKIDIDDIPDWIKEESQKMRKVLDDVYEKSREKYRDDTQNLMNEYLSSDMTKKEYKSRLKKIRDEYEIGTDKKAREAFNGYNSLEDIIDALTRGKAQGLDVVSYGHGSSYYARSGSATRETWANWCSLKLMRPDLADRLAKDFPELAETMEGMKERMLKVIENG